LKVVFELRDRLIERVDAASGAGLHDAAFHDGENEGGDGIEIEAGGKAMRGGCVAEAASDGLLPR